MLKHARQVLKSLSGILAAMNSYLLLTLLFFVVVVPLGLLFRILGKSVLTVRGRWVDSSTGPNYEKPF